MLADDATSCQTLRHEILQHLLSKLEHTPVYDTPFSHFYLEDAFPQAIYTRLLDSIPPPDAFRQGRQDKHMREDGVITKSSLALDEQILHHLPESQRQFWGSVRDALGSVDLKEAVFTRLSRDLGKRFNTAPERVHEIMAHPKTALIRNLDGYKIAPHPDGRSKIVTMQFYLAGDMNQVDLGTALYERHLFRLKTLINPRSRFEKVKQFPFKPNSGYGFAVSRKSFHGREVIPAATGVRNSLLHIYFDTPDRLAS